MADLHPAPSPERAFALMLETACEDFESLLAIISGELQVVAPERGATNRAVRAQARIVMALAKSFVFNARRANRIFDNNKAAIAVDRTERIRFLKATASLIDVRDVNEHGFDGDGKSKPSLHGQEGALLDETSLVITARDKILIGPLNLFTIYQQVDRMRKLAGFIALYERGRRN